MTDLLLAILLGVVQGLTEFLPVSSSGHLILVPWLLGARDPGLAFDVALHLGTLAALIVHTWRSWKDIVVAGLTRRTVGAFGPDVLWRLALASVPAAVAGVFLEDAAAGGLRSPWIVAGALAVVALLMAAADRTAGKGSAATVGWWPALAIGVAQAVALVPGVSRSGATMTMALFLGLSRSEAARFSFLLAVPVTVGAAAFALRGLTPADVTLPFVAGVAASAAVGVWAIRFLLRFLKEHTFAPFVTYRLALAGAVVLLALSRR